MRTLACSMTAVLLLAGCISQREIDDDTTCPCAPGWICDDQANVCVEDPTSGRISSGLKLFASGRVHDGDFLDDNRLSGATAIEKADDFCQQDPSKPPGGTYKALLVDGVTRDALSLTGWVLKPNTAYFQTKDDVRIATTTDNAIFPPYIEHFIHKNFGGDPSLATSTSLVWTGLADNLTFTAAAEGENCRGWTFRLNLEAAPQGICSGINGDQWWVNGGSACSLERRIYCVEQ